MTLVTEPRNEVTAGAGLAPSWWALGLTLAERVTLPDPPAAPAGDERAQRRLARWRRQHRLGDTGQFQRRLADLGLDEAGLLALLAEEPARLAARSARPRWAELVEQVVAGLAERRDLPPAPAQPETIAQSGFSIVVSPFLHATAERLETALHAVADLVDAKLLWTQFSNQLNQSLMTLASRTLILELNVLRVSGELTGATPAERFWSFVHQFTRPARFTAFLGEYPVLARLLAQNAEQTAAAWLELLGRFAADRPQIVDLLGGTDPGRLTQVRLGGGDQHRGGRSVGLLGFENGARLVYKPRPLAAHRHFTELVHWFGRALSTLELRVPDALDRGDYGWVEFVEHRPCATPEQVTRYYQRQGALLALLHAVRANDFHLENLIASGEHPVLVDLETMFHPTLHTAVGAQLQRLDPAAVALERSVLRIGLLPAVVWGEDGSAMDLSGLGGGQAGQRMPFKMPTWDGSGTDQMSITRVQHESQGSQNRPSIDGVDADPGRYTDELRAGFRAGCATIVKHRKQFAQRIGAFSPDEIRVVARSTRTFATLLSESSHPDVLRDALDRDRIFDQLWALSVDDAARARMVRHEVADLWAGDVPLFTTRPGSRDLWSSDGTRIAGLLDATGLQRATEVLDDLATNGSEVQEWIIQASMATRPTRSPDHHWHTDHPLWTNPSPGTPSDPDRLLKAARAVADRLADSAYRANGCVNWLGLEFVTAWRWRVQPLRMDLYNGFPGVALFLGQIAELTGEQRYADLAVQALSSVPSLLDGLAGVPAEQRARVVGCGAYGGPTGLAYTACQLAGLLGPARRDEWLDQLLPLVADAVPYDDVFDMVSGSAGCLATMLAVHSATGRADALAIARSAAQRLLHHAQRQESGLAWHTTANAIRPLTGFSHGGSGIGLALLRFAAAAAGHGPSDTGLEAFAYERAQYDDDLGNWPDYRTPAEGGPADGSDRSATLHAWCHGSPGIGLARAAGLAYTEDPKVAEDLEVALRSWRAARPMANHSLCHGELGNLEMLTVVRGSGHERAGEWDERAGAMLDRFEATGPVCGTPGAIPTPGLMVGLAGIGHGLLRLGFPDRVPSVLLLDPPTQGRMP